MSIIIHQASMLAGGGVSLMARIRIWDTTYMEQADVTSIAYEVYEMSTGVLGISGSLIKTAVVFDTLQTGPAWDIDAAGYNFKWDAPATICPASNKVYQAQVVITPSVGADIVVPPWELTTTNLIGK